MSESRTFFTNLSIIDHKQYSRRQTKKREFELSYTDKYGNKVRFLLHVSFSLTCNDLANALPVGASLIVSIRKSTLSVPWSVKHQDLKFRQMFEKSERLWRILNCVIKLHPVIVFKFKSAIAVFDKEIPSIFIETVQSSVLKSILIPPYTGCFINA